jgi:hypothetical protein
LKFWKRLKNSLCLFFLLFKNLAMIKEICFRLNRLHLYGLYRKFVFSFLSCVRLEPHNMMCNMSSIIKKIYKRRARRRSREISIKMRKSFLCFIIIALCSFSSSFDIIRCRCVLVVLEKGMRESQEWAKDLIYVFHDKSKDSHWSQKLHQWCLLCGQNDEAK